VKVTSLPKKSLKPETVVVDAGSPKAEKKFVRSSSLSTFFNAFSRKKSAQKVEGRKISADMVPTLPRLFFTSSNIVCHPQVKQRIVSSISLL
jgi:hypothetical protein